MLQLDPAIILPCITTPPPVSKIFDKFTRHRVNLLYHDVITQSLRLLKEKHMSKKINPDKQQKGVKRAAKNTKRKAKKSK
ncbi:MAG: hypothetical protein RLZZ361_376 [Cyanobacteriota bacterium]|jgi:hypothetical protein